MVINDVLWLLHVMAIYEEIWCMYMYGVTDHKVYMASVDMRVH